MYDRAIGAPPFDTRGIRPDRRAGCLRRRGGGSLLLAAVLVGLVTTLALVAVSASARPAARVSRACEVPRLTGVTFAAAATRAAHAGCSLHVRGATLEDRAIQTVARQSPEHGGRATKVVLWLNPLCAGSVAYGPDLTEPLLTAGPTELRSGFYLVGGPLQRFSSAGCKRPAPSPQAGTVEVMNAAGALVATQTSTDGHFIEIPLAAGSYTVKGTFADASVNGLHPRKAESLVIPPGHTVRQDFFLDVP